MTKRSTVTIEKKDVVEIEEIKSGENCKSESSAPDSQIDKLYSQLKLNSSYLVHMKAGNSIPGTLSYITDKTSFELRHLDGRITIIAFNDVEAIENCDSPKEISIVGTPLSNRSNLIKVGIHQTKVGETYLIANGNLPPFFGVCTEASRQYFRVRLPDEGIKTVNNESLNGTHGTKGRGIFQLSSITDNGWNAFVYNRNITIQKHNVTVLELNAAQFDLENGCPVQIESPTKDSVIVVFEGKVTFRYTDIGWTISTISSTDS